MKCSFRNFSIREDIAKCPNTAVWLIDDGMGTTVPACNWHVGALLSEEGENLVYKAELPTAGVPEEIDAARD